MKTLLILFFASQSLFAYDGITIENFHKVGRSGNVFRGREPKTKVEELAHERFTDVIIFKNEVKSEVKQELKLLDKFRITSHHIPFKWKELNSAEEACEQVVDALKVLEQVKKENGKVFFHCTAGEDRTGMLSGLFLMLTERKSMNVVFREEMCAKGYSDGSEHKPSHVTSAIQKELTPLFIALAEKIQKGEWRAGRLTKSSCKNLKLKPTTLRCRK